MMQLGTWFTFFVMMTAIAYTPGPMTMFAMSSSVKHGLYRTLPGIFGGSAAYMIQMVVVYLGLGVIVQNSTVVFNIIKWVGVIYLILLGVKNWRQSVQNMEMTHTGLPVSPVKQFSLGCATGMSNPKSILVFTVTGILITAFFEAKYSTIFHLHGLVANHLFSNISTFPVLFDRLSRH